MINVFLWLKNKFRRDIIKNKGSNNTMHQIDIVNNWLHIDSKAAEKVPCKENKFSAQSNVADYLVIHHTGGTTASGAHAQFQKQGTQVSWHLTIDRNGKVFQLYDFRKTTWHAGKSRWNNIDGLNRWSIGIELVAAGPLDIINGSYYTWSRNMIPNHDVVFDNNGNPWHSITQEQVNACLYIGAALIRQYKMKDVMGHNEISPGRKNDPGPHGLEQIVYPLRRFIQNGI